MIDIIRKNIINIIICKKKLCVGLILIASLMLSGCLAKQDEEQNISEQVKEFYASIKKVDTSSNDNDAIVVGSVNMGMNGEWFKEVMNGIRDAGNDLGVTLEMLDSESDLNKEAENISELINRGIDVLVISPIDSNVSAQSLKKAQEANIPIITWNTTVNMEVTAAVGVDAAELGGKTGNYLVEYIKMNGLSKVNLYLLTNTSYDIGEARCNGFKSAIQTLVNEGIINIVAEDDFEALEDAAAATAKALKEHPEINMIWAWNQSSLLGAIESVKAAKAKDIVIMGTDMSMALADDMLADEISLQAITTQLPYNMGYKAVVNAVKAAKGEDVEKQVFIPLSTLIKDDVDDIKQYIENHKNLVGE